MQALRRLIIPITIVALFSSCNSKRVTVLWGHPNEDGTCTIDSLSHAKYRIKDGYRPVMPNNHYYITGPTLRAGNGDNEWTILEPVVQTDSASLARAFPTVMKMRLSDHSWSFGPLTKLGIVVLGKKEQHISMQIVCTER